jgi:hypothetical protein
MRRIVWIFFGDERALNWEPVAVSFICIAGQLIGARLMRPSILAMLVAFGTTITMSATAQQPSTAPKQMAPSEQPSTAQQQMPNQQMQNEADKGVKTRNSGESGYVADQEKPGASAQPPGRPGTNPTTTGSNSKPTGTGPREPR